MSRLPRRQVLRACAAATLLAAAGGRAWKAARPPKTAAGEAAAFRVFFFDPQHASSQALAARLLPRWGTLIELGGDWTAGTARALPAGTHLLAGRTTYADFTWLAGLASEYRLRARFHAYYTLDAAGTVERRVLIEDGAPASQLQRLRLAGCAQWLEALAPGCVGAGRVSSAADRAGCTLHDWVFQAA